MSKLDWQSQSTGEPKPKCHVIWILGQEPDGLPDNHKMESIGDSGWRRSHMNDVSLWLNFIDDGVPCYDDLIKVYTESTISDDSGEECTVYSFDAGATVGNLVTALSSVLDDDWDGDAGFIVLSSSEFKACKATDYYQDNYATN